MGTHVLLGLLVAFAPVVRDAQDPADALAKDLEAKEWELARAFVNRTYDIGVEYYKSGYRKEAIWFFQHTLELVPRNGALRGFVNLIQDFDNPVWKKKEWRSPRAGEEREFKKRVAKWEEDCARIWFEMGKYAASKRTEAADEKALGYYLKLLRMTEGPYEVGRDKKLRVGKVGSIPEPFSSRILDQHLVRVNGQLYVRDAMLAAIPDVATVSEARGERCLVRVEGEEEKARGLLALMEQACAQYAAHTKQSALRPLGLFVFADRAGYERFCHASGNAALANASGFASGALGFAVTFDHPALQELAVHEGAHLFHAAVYRSRMPSWYDEGFACWFGHGGTFRVADGKLETGLPLDRARLEALAREKPPLRELLDGDAAARFAANDGSFARFYAHAWALYTFLRTTKDKRFAPLFEKWESFCLGAGYDAATQGTSSKALFDEVFAAVLQELETALAKWIEEQVAAAR